MQCEYPGCSHTEPSDDPKKCIFHADVDKKRISNEEFEGRIFDLLQNRNYDFQGFIFVSQLLIENITLHKTLNLQGAEFHGDYTPNISFQNVTFEVGINLQGAKIHKGGILFISCTMGKLNGNMLEVVEGVSDFDSCKFNDNLFFRKAKFNSGAIFLGCEFNGYLIDFNGAYFGGDLSTFARSRFNLKTGEMSLFKTLFSSKETNFNYTRFIGENDADFDNALFIGEKIFFNETIFDQCHVTFKSTNFGKGLISFNKVSFSNDVSFKGNQIGGKIEFSDITLDEKSNFNFDAPIFDGQTKLPPVVMFEKVPFVPFKTFFEGFQAISNKEDISKKSITKNKDEFNFKFGVIFRHCTLRHVYFSNCFMSFFSFYKSAYFEDAFLEQPKWKDLSEPILGKFKLFKKYERKNHIFEDLFQNEIKDEEIQKLLRPHFKLEELETNWEVALLYQRYKTAGDNAKNYHMASWFYFNEFEMKRLALKSKDGLMGLTGNFLYSIFKLFTGYGEKPNWTAGWFLIAWVFFSIGHLFNGITVEGESFYYKLAMCECPDISKLADDFLSSTYLTFVRILPSNYVPESDKVFGLANTTTGDNIFAVFNTVVLTLLAVFIGIGLKRHFRRF